MLSLFCIIILSYLVGSIPTSYIVGRLIKRIDIREHGSGNVGATNVYRVVGTKSAIFVLLVDIAKGVIAVLLISQLRVDTVPLDNTSLPIIAGICAIIGHIWTLWLKFKGGKGVATATGVFLGLAPIATGCAFIVWIVIVITTRYVSLGSISAALCLPFVIGLQKFLFKQQISSIFFVISCVIGVLIVFKHRTNISRLVAGKENKFELKM